VSWRGADRERCTKEIKGDWFAGKLLNVNSRHEDGYGNLCQIV
jgi:hypothetical protein